jgi:CHAT domain-containing protein
LHSPGSTPDELRLLGCAGGILRESEGDRSIEMVHAAGIAHLLVGQLSEAVNEIEEASRRAPLNAAIWNDLAATRYEQSTEVYGFDRLPAALAAVDHALRLAPAMSEARFNRALILTRLGLRGDARDAWHDSLMGDGDANWLAEARRRMRETAASAGEPSFSSELALALGPSEVALRELVRRRPQDARTLGETLILAAWADAAARDDAASAERELRKARRIGAALAATNGDRLLADVVQSIDSAPAASRRYAKLVAAHRAYRDSREHYSQSLAGSDSDLTHSANLFASVHSPMAQVALYYSANAAFDRNHVERAHTLLDRVLREIDVSRYPSLSAGAEKENGLYYGFRGMWTASIVHLERARSIFARLGETGNAAFTDAIIGEVHDRIGRFDEGWRHRSAALAVLTGRPPDGRFVAVLGGAIHAEILRSDYDSALSLLRIGLDHAVRVGNAELTTEMIVRQARVSLAEGNGDDAAAALHRARTAATAVADKRMRTRVTAEIALVEGESLRRRNPRRAVSKLTSAISLYEANGFGMFLPPAYLQRGLSHRACGETTAALADFQRGLNEIERQRANVALDLRATLFDTVPDLVAETVDLLLARHRKNEAFGVVERARARTLIEALGRLRGAPETTGDAVAAVLPANAAVIEYAFLPRGVAVFCIRRDGVTVDRLTADPVALRDRIALFANAIIDRRPIDEVQQRSSELYATLIMPIENRLAGASTIFIVPDRSLCAMPFAALFDRRRRQYLIEERRIVISPSAAFIAQRARTHLRLRPALVIGNPVSWSGGSPLRAVSREAEEIATLYRTVVIPRREATIDRFVKLAPSSALIHYAGHAHTDDAAGGFLPLAPSPGSDGRLDVTAISHLPLGHTRLVVLSACATLRGNFAHVEGMPSIARAFLTAGVASVVGMLWDVEDDDAAVLALAFHQHLNDGESPSAALQEAQRALLHSADVRARHPASWAVAELLGVN